MALKRTACRRQLKKSPLPLYDSDADSSEDEAVDRFGDLSTAKDGRSYRGHTVHFWTIPFSNVEGPRQQTRPRPGHICFLANGVATICGAAAMAFARGESYSQVVKRHYLVGAAGAPGTGDMLLWCLGPALVSTGVQMFQYRSRIAALSRVLFLTCSAVSLCNILGTVVAGPLLGVSPEVTLAATMRCVTIPMALPTYARLCDASGAENNVALVALCAGVSGFIGFGFSQRFLSSAICGSTADPVARGIATGAAAHALGAACLVATEPEAFVWGMLSMAVSGVASAAWICACQPLRFNLFYFCGLSSWSLWHTATPPAETPEERRQKRQPLRARKSSEKKTSPTLHLPPPPPYSASWRKAHMSALRSALLHVCLAAIAFGQDYLNDTANSSDENMSDEVPSTTTTTLSTLSSTTTFTVSRTTSTQSSTSVTSTTETFTTATSTSQTTTTTESNTTTSSTSTSTYTNTTQTMTSSTATTQTTSLTTTTTSFTSTNTTTTTTSTTTTRVYFLSVDLAQLTATHLTLSFNYPARWVQEINVTWGCDALFDAVTAENLGMSPGCSMSEDLVRLQVVLGQRSYLQVGDLVTLLFGVFVPASGVYLPTEMEATVTTEEPAVAVHAVLVAPDISPVCARLRFSTALSRGFAGRAPSVSWHFGNGTHEDLGRVLQPALDEASDYAEQVLEIPPETLFAAVSEVQANESNWSEMVLEVVSTITNWHGEQDEATAMLTVLNVEEPLPQLVPGMLSELQFLPSEEAEMAVQVYPTETAAYCVDSIRRSGRVDTIVRQEGNETWIETLPPEPVAPAEPGVIRIRWEYRRLDDGACVWVSRAGNESNETENASNGTNLSEWNSTGNFSCAMMYWQPLETLGFANRARDPSVQRLPAFTLPPNSSHQFRASAFREDLEEFSNRSMVTYTVSVLPRSRPMASVIGPPVASASCAFAVRAEAWEVAAMASRGPGEGPRFEYAWSCLVGDMEEMNESEVLYAERCLPRLAHWEGPSLTVQAGELEEDTYTFRVHVRRPGPGEEWSEAYWSVKVGMEPWPHVALTVPWRSNEALSTASQDVRAVAEVMGSSSCPVPIWTWQWVLVSASSTILALLRTMNESSLEEPLGNTSLSTADFRHHLLRSGHRYAYALVAHDASNAAAQLLLENSTLQQLQSAGAFVSWSHFFLADGPPAFGLVESAPRSGYAVSSLFTLNTFGWFDELEDGVSYAFFRFPLDNIPGLGADSLYDAAPGNDVEWRLPHTDWHNVSSPAYFQRQGGLLLRPWDRAKSVSDVILAAGSYYLVVRARDALGAEGVASVLGPVVSEPAFLSATETTNALKVAAASSDADRILNAVDAALSVPVSEPFESSLLEAMEAG
eukprot:s101_g16.t3